MGVTRKWIFPIFRILLIAAIAVALVKLAFFPAEAEAADPALPTGAAIEPHYTVAAGTISNDVTLKATVAADPAVPVKTTAQGTVDEIFYQAGTAVNAGDEIFDVKVETQRDPADAVAEDGSILPPVITYEEVLAPTTGILSSLNVIEDQSVSVGDAAGQIAPPSFSVSGSLDPQQEYRLVNQPTEAQVTITGGPAPFTCTGLGVSTPLAGSGANSAGPPVGQDAGGAASGSGSGSGSGTTVSCPIPAGVTVFAGLAAELTIAGGKAENVLVAPTTAVLGAAQTGTVWVVAPDGTSEQHDVTLGLNDGKNVEVKTGLAAGDVILQFAPGAPADNPDGQNCVSIGNGGMACSGAGG
jgi:macrolide-specific efflux system membrane fusion protein